MREHEYMRRIRLHQQALQDSLTGKKILLHIEIAHDDTCGVHEGVRGAICACDPTITVEHPDGVFQIGRNGERIDIPKQ